jgi:hypothetical protein
MNSLDYAKFLNAPSGEVQFTVNEVRDFSSDLLREMAVYSPGIVVKDPRVIDELRKKGLAHVNPATRRWLYSLATQRKIVTLSDGESVRIYAEAKKLPVVFTDKVAKIGDEEKPVGIVATNTPMTVPRQRLVALLCCLFRFDGSVWVPCVDANSFAKKHYDAIQKTGLEPFVPHMNILFPPRDIPQGVRDGPALLAHLTRCILTAEASSIHLLTNGIIKELLELPPLQRNNQGQMVPDPTSPIKYVGSMEKPIIAGNLNARHIGYTGDDMVKVYSACVASGAMWARSLATDLIRGSDSIALPTENQYLTELILSIALCHDRVAISGVGPAIYERVLSSLDSWKSQRQTTSRIIVAPDRMLNSGKYKEYLTLSPPGDGFFSIVVCESPFGTFQVMKGADIRVAMAAYKNEVSNIMTTRQDMIPKNGVLIGRLLPQDTSIVCYRTRIPSDGFGIFSRSTRDLKRIGSQDGRTLTTPEPLHSMNYSSWYKEVLKAVNTLNVQFAIPYISKVPYYANLVKPPLVKESITSQEGYVDMDGLIQANLTGSAEVGDAAQVQQIVTMIRPPKYHNVTGYVPLSGTPSPSAPAFESPTPVVSALTQTLPGLSSVVTTLTPAPAQISVPSIPVPQAWLAPPLESQNKGSGSDVMDAGDVFLSSDAWI